MHLRYFESMYSVISDQTKFKLITSPIHKFSLKTEEKINNFLRKLKNFKLLSDDTYKLLFVTGSGPGVLYGLPKIHKVNSATQFPFRPIFAAYRNPSFSLPKFLVPILAPLTTNEFTVTNSYEFTECIS